MGRAHLKFKCAQFAASQADARSIAIYVAFCWTAIMCVLAVGGKASLDVFLDRVRTIVFLTKFRWKRDPKGT